jgi:integrase
MYAGLRCGELLALRIEDVNLAAGVIHVRRGWDTVEGEITTKSGKERRVPIAAVLRDYLDEHLLQLAWSEGLIFGRSPVSPFSADKLRKGALHSWGWKRRHGNGKPEEWVRAGEDALEPIGLHECRHTFASLMIAAGVNAKALSTYMGHANISITLDRYGHLMPGNEDEAAGLLDAYLARANLAPVAPVSDRIQSDPIGVDLP